ncbi:cupin domain-containing protein [Ottowia sp.]|uniref:JmjC domain-containing protein n=1 Tax=Ottowia sp. TaxID=1898956 RepID=UPI0025D24670|nr:cupin domain-containing protein [Ottowia sp.]MBK6612713.1 cupin domain-containing protein [Ottowia sp.]MBK6748161.1 cupin domain-containing protein [Ottowia sp.]
MDISQPLRLLGGLSPAQFMKRHWQKKPLLVRQAIPGFQPLLSRPALFDLAADAAVESRLLRHGGGRWTLRQGPLPRRGLPPLGQPDWTLLVQGVDLHHAGVHALLRQFRFVPDARLDDVMISYATEGGGVGPHFDSYDVFLLQAHGRRRWRIGRQKDLRLVEGLPLKILADFEPEEEYVLDPGDMLYLPPRWAHDGVALGECMTYSIGFRQPARGELARELLQRLADEAGDGLGDAAYRDPGQAAVAAPGAVPPAMFDFARDAVERALRDPAQLAMLLGEWLTEPKPNVWFDTPPARGDAAGGVALDRRTRMMYDERHVFINGEGYRASGRDARLMRQLADERSLGAGQVARLSEDAQFLLAQWKEAGWLHDDA